MRAWHVALAFAVGAAVGHLASAREPAVVRSLVAASPQEIRAAPALDVAALTAEIRRAVADECHVAATAPAAAPPAEPAAESPESVEARDRGLAIVETALAAGAWTEADVNAFRPHFVRMTGAQRDEVLGTLLPAINEGRLRAQLGPGPPF